MTEIFRFNRNSQLPTTLLELIKTPNFDKFMKFFAILPLPLPVARFEPLILGLRLVSGNTKGGSIIVPLSSCLTGLESAV
jgi:hypothetical protein